MSRWVRHDALRYVLSGISLAFATDLLCEWFRERDMRHVANALKRAAVDDQLVVRSPPPRRRVL